MDDHNNAAVTLTSAILKQIHAEFRKPGVWYSKHLEEILHELNGRVYFLTCKTFLAPLTELFHELGEDILDLRSLDTMYFGGSSVYLFSLIVFLMSKYKYYYKLELDCKGSIYALPRCFYMALAECKGCPSTLQAGYNQVRLVGSVVQFLLEKLDLNFDMEAIVVYPDIRGRSSSSRDYTTANIMWE